MTFVAVCALCWLGYCCKQLLEIYADSRKQLFETELSLYREAVRREALIQNERMTEEQFAIRLETKRKELELAKLDKELRVVKEAAK